MAVVLQRRTGNNKNVIFNLKTEETENVETSLQFLKLLYIFWPLGKKTTGDLNNVRLKFLSHFLAK